MKAYYLLAPVGVALLAGCADYPTVAYTTPVYTQPATVAYVAPRTTYVAPRTTYVAPRTTYVAPSYNYVTPPNTVILGAGPSWNQFDSDGDGYPDRIDNYPYDPRFH